MSGRLPEKRVLLRLLARRRDRRYRDESMALTMIVVEDQIRQAGAGALANLWRRAREGVYRRKDFDMLEGCYRYTLGVQRPERMETEWPETIAYGDWDSPATTSVTARRIPAVHIVIGVTCYSFDKRDTTAGKLWAARRELRRAVEIAIR